MFINNFDPIDFADIPVQTEFDQFGRPVGSCIVDQTGAQVFMTGPNGFRRSDIGILMEAQSYEVQQQILSRLVDLSSGRDTSDMSNEELIDEVIPRHLLSLPDLRDWSARENGSIGKAVQAKLDSLKSVRNNLSVDPVVPKSTEQILNEV